MVNLSFPKYFNGDFTTSAKITDFSYAVVFDDKNSISKKKATADYISQIC